MKIGIIGAMKQEVAILKDAMTQPEQKQKAGCTFFVGQIYGVDVVLLQSGVGKVSAAVGTTILLNDYHPDVIINTGSAGGFDRSFSMGDIAISTEVLHHDADVTGFGYKMGQMANQPATFKADEQLIKIAEKAVTATENVQSLSGLICTGDTFVCTQERHAFIRQHFPSVIAVDMEAAAIAQTCLQFNVPFVIVRAISDVADKMSPMSFDEFLPLAAQQSSKMVISMIQQLK